MGTDRALIEDFRPIITDYRLIIATLNGNDFTKDTIVCARNKTVPQSDPDGIMRHFILYLHLNCISRFYSRVNDLTYDTYLYKRLLVYRFLYLNRIYNTLAGFCKR